MREIVLDTETTGIKPEDGHRIVEIGCVEIFNRVRTGEVFHCYLNPERSMPQEAFSVHGLSEDFLKDKKLFADVADEFITFIGDSKLVIHNAQFDMKFLNHELKKIGKPQLDNDRAVDTLNIARNKFPGAPASLDALCRRFNVDLSARDKHGALLDAELLSAVYAELVGGVQSTFDLNAAGIAAAANAKKAQVQSRPAFEPSAEEKQTHAEFMKKVKSPLWDEA